MTLGNNDVPPARGFVQDVVDAARENPASTALISMGLLWMVMGRDGGSVLGKLRDAGRSAGQTAASGIGAGGRSVGAGASAVAASASGVVKGLSSTVSDAFGTVADHASDVGSAASRHAADRASTAASAGSSTFASVGDGLRAVSHDARDMASSGAASAKDVGARAAMGTSDRASDLMTSLRSGFADLLQRQPLVLGAVGLAVGAGVAAALPRIAAEDAFAETIGGLKESVREGLGGAYERAANEARAQGLTPQAASQAMADVGATVKDVAKTTLDDAKANMS